MASIPIYNPQSPFLGLIPGGFRVGSTIKIRAQIQGFSNRCQISFQSGAALQPRDDVMLHISVRPQENAIVRNHLKNQVWGAEERHGGNPIQSNQSFEIAVSVEHSIYRISVNGQHFCTFTHRLPVNLVQFVSISGTCTISYITNDQIVPTPAHPPIHVHPSFPVAPSAPRYPIHHHHHPPAPPPMPPHVAPPPYPGLYPGHQHPTPYTTPNENSNSNKKSLKLAAGVGAAVGLTAIAISKAARDIKNKK